MADGAEPKIAAHHITELTCFFRAHDRWLFGHACVRAHGDRELAADLVQDTFEAAARTWPTLREHETGRQRAWLLATLANKNVTEFRRAEAFRNRQPEIHVRYLPTAADTEAQALNAIALERARAIVEAMPPRQRQIALMRWEGHRKATEIAADLGLAEGTVHAQLHAARAKLKAGLKQYYPFAENEKDDEDHKGDNDDSEEGTAS